MHDPAHADGKARARQGVENNGHRCARLDPAEVVLGHFGIHPHVVDGDQGHLRAAGGGELADIAAQVGDQPRGAGTHPGVGEVQFGLAQGRGGAAQLGVFVFVAALLFAGPLDFGVGGGDLADGLFVGGAGDFQTAQGDGPGILAVQAFEAVAVLPGLQLVGLVGAQGGQGRVDAGGAGADLPAHRFEVGAGAVDGDLVLLGIDLEQQVAGFDVLVVVRLHLDHPPGHFAGHRHHIGLHPRLLGVGGEAVGEKVPEQAQGDQHGHPAGAFFHRVGGGCGGRLSGGRGVTHRGLPGRGWPGSGRVGQACRPSRCGLASVCGWPHPAAVAGCTSRRRGPCTGRSGC